MEELDKVFEHIKEQQKILVDELEKKYIDKDITKEEKENIEFILRQNKALKIAIENKDLAEINNIYNTLADASYDR